MSNETAIKHRHLKRTIESSEYEDRKDSPKKPRADVGSGSKPTTRRQDSEESIPSDQPAHSKDENDYSEETPPKDFSTWRVNEITNGEVYYFPEFVPVNCASEWHDSLRKLDSWYHPKLKVYGKEVNQSRSIAAYTSDKNLTVKYSGHTVQLHHDYPPLLQEVQKQVEEFLDEKFNHVMLNLYENGQEYIGKHRDTKENKVITSLSLGAERTFIMTPNKNNTRASSHKWTLANGSLLVMRGKTQDNWKHEIPKEAKIKESRISLTFRQLTTP